MSNDPLSSSSPPLDRKYKDVYLDNFRKQAVYAALVVCLIEYIFTTLFSLRITSLKNLLWTPFQTKVLWTSTLCGIILIFLGIIRSTQISVWRPKHLSAGAELLAAFRNQDYYIMAACYALSGVVMIRIYFSTLMEESYTSQWFTYPPGHRAYARELNMENLFILFYGLILGAGYSAKHIIEEKDLLRIPPVQQPKAAAIKASMSTMIHSSRKYAGKAFLVSYVVFMTTKNIVYYMVVPFVGFFWSGILASPVMGFRWYDLYLILRMLMAGTFVVLGWEMADRVFDDDDNTLIRSMAYAELARLATQEPDRRVKLFLDTNHDFTTSAWKSISEECIHTLDTLCTRLRNEYTTTKKPQDPYLEQLWKQTTPTKPPSTILRRISLKEGDIISRHDEYNADGRRLDDRTLGLFVSENSIIDQDTETSWAATATTSPLVQLDDDKWAMLPRLLVKDGLERISQFGWIKNMSVITIDQKTRTLFSNSPDLINAIQALGGLTISSFKEDTYGYVQHDIAKVLDALVGTLLDVEHFISSPPDSYRSLPHLYNGQCVWTEPEAVIRALNDSIYEIAMTFSDYMDQVKIRVQKKYQAKLSGFL
ncbi:nucleoporin protein Ndc1-Nup [Absidia repens]|uniref:Nucleoporin protein Ndc1-Nup n=1 Tax=Absidia repens TaxID=90262 RepID=A0A1X2IWD5_9FUNG|nr:nucleoporin protein Ndc1-Nup [Absidia repens]